MKTISLQPIDEDQQVHTGGRLLEALLARRLKVQTACRGKGVCATCHVFVRQGGDQLSPRSEREKRTLSLISGNRPDSRLSCQCHVLGNGVVVEVPPGMYVERSSDLLSMLGSRAPQDLLHPITGAVLIAAGKIVTRSRLEELRRVEQELRQAEQEADDGFRLNV